MPHDRVLYVLGLFELQGNRRIGVFDIRMPWFGFAMSKNRQNIDLCYVESHS